jgi:hypothetical protein
MNLREISAPKRKVKTAKEFIAWAVKKLDIKKEPNVVFTHDKEEVRKKRTFGTTMQTGDVWVYVGERNTADMLRTLCHELVHVRQFEIGTAHSSMTKEEEQAIEDEANAIAGRMMREYGKMHVAIYEGRTGSIQADVAAALPATYAIPELKNQDPYLQYRFAVAIAGAKGAKKRAEDGVQSYSKESEWGENEIVVSFDPDIETYIDDALKEIGMTGKKLISTRKSEEANDVKKSSVLKSFKGYGR